MTVAHLDTGPDEVPHASVLTRISQQVGGASGTAILAVLLDATVQVTDDPLAALHRAFWRAVGFTAIALVACRRLPGRRAAAHDEAAAEERTTEPVGEPPAHVDRRRLAMRRRLAAPAAAEVRRRRRRACRGW